MNERVLRRYWRFFCLAWRLFRKYRNVKKDAEWNQLVQEAIELREQYPGEFSRQVIMAILSELDRRAGVESYGK